MSCRTEDREDGERWRKSQRLKWSLRLGKGVFTTAAAAAGRGARPSWWRQAFDLHKNTWDQTPARNGCWVAISRHIWGGGQKSCRVLDSLKKKKKKTKQPFSPFYRAGPKKRTSPERTIGSNGREEEEGIAMTLPCTRAHSLLCFPLVRRRRLAKRKTGKRRRCFWGSTAREAGALASTKGKPGTRVAALLPAGIPVCRSEHRKRQEFRGGGFDILYCALKSEHREIKNNTG